MLLMSVQIDQHLIIWPIAIKGICRKQYGQIAFTVAVQISFHNYFARKYVRPTENQVLLFSIQILYWRGLLILFLLKIFDHQILFYVSEIFVLL